MMIAVASYVALAILCCASADDVSNVSTSLLLPNGLFNPVPIVQLPTFSGQVAVTRSTTYYVLGCNVFSSDYTFFPGGDCDYGVSSSYTFSEISASTQYLLEYTETILDIAAASSSTDQVLETTTINCNPVGPFGSATCTSIYPDDAENPPYSTNVESLLYPVIFTAAVGYSAAITPSPTSSTATTKPTTTPSPSSTTAPNSTLNSKIGIGLGILLGACAFVAVAWLLYRHGKHKERSRVIQMRNLAPPPPPPFASDSDGKRFSEAESSFQTAGRSPPVYSMEMQG